MNTNKKRISRSFQNWLLLLVALAFLATTAFLWSFQTQLAQNNTIRLLDLNISDVRDDIQDASAIRRRLHISEGDCTRF